MAGLGITLLFELPSPQRRSGMDCRNPGAMDGLGFHVPVAWIPAIPAGMTTSIKETEMDTVLDELNEALAA